MSWYIMLCVSALPKAVLVYFGRITALSIKAGDMYLFIFIYGQKQQYLFCFCLNAEYG